MSENLWAFDQLARRSIDAGLQSAANERQDANLDYVIEVPLDRSPARTRCLLTIKNGLPTKPSLAGSCEVSAGPGDTVLISRSYWWTNNGTPFDVLPLQAAEISEAEIKRLALDFIDGFFREVQRLAK
jgi:hypothetical protein